MKTSILTLGTIIAFIAGSTFLTSCGSGNKNESESTEHQDMDGHNHGDIATADFSCPMHPEVTGIEGDKCSKCGMFLTKSSAETEGDSEEQMQEIDTVSFICPMHPEVKGINGETCSKCNMDLVASTNEMSMKGCMHKPGEKCANCSATDATKCTCKDAASCTCNKDGMKCMHKDGKSCANCKKA